ncbi:hypothetical protein T484DRAFT_1814732 [Baffinella frigidus]|nr:hypothetical protein T484DRAFT_1814732 [Cryptophyta sp. CCMP2293]
MVGRASQAGARAIVRTIQARNFSGGVGASVPLVNVDVIQTPNPDALKFVPGGEVTGSLRSVAVRAKDLESGGEVEEGLARVARALLAVDGVASLLFGFDFVTVEKTAEVDWDGLEEAICAVLQKEAALARADDRAMVPVAGGDSTAGGCGIEVRVREVLEEKVLPNVQADGGDVIFRGFENGVVWLSMVGACSSCPSSTITLKFMIRNLLIHEIDEVTDVRALGQDENMDARS